MSHVYKALTPACMRRPWLANRWRPGSQRLRDPQGFTLTELMVVVALISTLAVMALPNIQPLVTTYRLNGAAREVMGDLMAARMKAVSQHRNYQVFFTSSQSYTICDDANGDGTVEHGEGAAQVRHLPATYPGVSVAATTDPLFTAKGTAAGTATITLTNAHGTKTVAISRTGHVKIH
jgi:type IV fimbrial biogenesis protein FimT